jgi:ribokinase
MARVVVVGSYNQDHVWRVDRFAQPGETRRGIDFMTGPGGKGFNQAVASARQDVPTAFIGAIGNDAIGETAQNIARRERLDARWQILDKVATGTCGIIVDGEGQNQIVVALAANEHLSPDFVEAQGEVFEDARVLLVQMENNMPAIATALAMAGERGILRVVNPAPVHPELTVKELAMADVLTPNEGEFATLCGRFLNIDVTADTVAGMDDTTLNALARRFGDDTTVVITLGSQGCFISHGNTRRGDGDAVYRVPAEKAKVVDTTGAGDAFNGALAAALARDVDGRFRDAVSMANRVAAMSTERAGAASAMPTRDDVLRRFTEPK